MTDAPKPAHRPGVDAAAAECCRLLGVNPVQNPVAVERLAQVIEERVSK